MIDLGGYIEYLRHDKDTRYSDSTNAAIQDERLKIADDLERMLSNAAQGVGEVEALVQTWRSECGPDYQNCADELTALLRKLQQGAE